MSISYDKQPPLVSLADDNRRVILTTTNDVITAGIKAETVIEFMSLPANNSNMVLTWNNGDTTQVWEFVNVLPANDFQIQLPPDPFAMDAYEILITNIRNAFSGNYQLSKIFDFTITFSSTDAAIILEAKEIGSDFNIVVGGNAGVGAPVQVGVDEELRDNYKLRLLLETFSKGNVNQKQFELTQPVIDETCSFPISPALMANPISNPLPQLNMSAALDASEQVIHYRYRHAEQFGVPVVVGNVSSNSSVRYALPGGSSINHPINLNDHLDAGNLPTYRAKRHTIFPGEELILPVFVHLAGLPFTNLIMEVVVYQSNLITTTETIFPQSAPQLGDLFYFPINPDVVVNELGFDVEELYSLEIQFKLSHSGSEFSDKYTFAYNHMPVVDHNIFMFRNSFGVFDFFNTHGVLTRGIEMESSKGRDVNGGMFRHNVLREKGFRVNTGFVEKQNMDFLADFLGSKEIYIFRENEVIPVTIDDMDVDIESVRMGHVNSAEFMCIVEKTKYHGII